MPRNVLIDRRKDGAEIHVEKTITPLLDSNGEITHFVSTDRDITSRRLAEVKLQQSELRFRNLVEQAGDALVALIARIERHIEARYAIRTVWVCGGGW